MRFQKGGNDIHQLYKQFQHFFKKNVVLIDLNIMCFIMNIIIARQKFSPHPIYLSFQSSVIVRIAGI